MTERIEYHTTVSTTIVKSWRFEYDGIQLLRVDERYDSNNSGSITEADSWRRLHENSHRPGSLSHLLAKKVYNYASGTTGTPSGSTDYFYAYDPVGNVVAISNGAGTRTYAFTQDAWGNELSVGAFTGDSWTTARNAGIWEHQTGKWIDPFTGLYFFHARFYDSKVGRFVGRDPVAHFRNNTLYTYCRENSLCYVDPEGRSSSGSGSSSGSSGSSSSGCSSCSDPGYNGPGFASLCEGPSCGCTLRSIAGWSKDLRNWINGSWSNGTGIKGWDLNAFRHCLWQCLITFHCGSGWATTAGRGHEGMENLTGGKDHYNDLINNVIGRQFGKSSKSCLDCYRKCRFALDNDLLSTGGGDDWF